MNKILSSLSEAMRLCGIRDGMSLSFHHHLRNGDKVLNAVLAEAARMGLKGLKLQASSVFDVHEPLIGHMRSGVVGGLETDYMGSLVGRAVSQGALPVPVVFRTHGGRAEAIDSGRAHIDIAFIAAPAADRRGNANGVRGPAACGSLGYACPDARNADRVVVVTDHIEEYPLFPASIGEEDVDWVVKTDSIGDPAGIVSGTTKITRDPVGLAIARLTASLIEHSGLLKEGFSFQTGAGGLSLAVTGFLKPVMKRLGIAGSYGLGGITGPMVDMLREGCFRTLMDVQCFDLQAVESLRDNPWHREISATRYASPGARSAAVDSLDAVVLGAAEIDTGFNVNVHTDSSGLIMGGAGGHSDAAAGARLAIVAAPLFRARLPIVVGKVQCVSTPGSTVDALVTQKGIAVNPARPDLQDRLRQAGLPVCDIAQLKAMAEGFTGVPAAVSQAGRVVADVEYRDGKVIDCIRGVG